MPKALQQPLHPRNTALHPANQSEILSGIASKPRTDGKRAVLVNPRRAVFDAAVPREADQTALTVQTQPGEFDHAGFSRWTPDLVHYRLICTGETIARLPSGSRGDFVSMLGSAALADMLPDKPRKSSPTPAEISRAEWTWDQVAVRPATQRVILVGLIFQMKVRDVAAILSRMGTVAVNLKRSAVSEWGTQECARFAKVWQAGHTVDPVTQTIRRLGPLALLDPATVERFRADHERAEN